MQQTTAPTGRVLRAISVNCGALFNDSAHVSRRPCSGARSADHDSTPPEPPRNPPPSSIEKLQQKNARRVRVARRFTRLGKGAKDSRGSIRASRVSSRQKKQSRYWESRGVVGVFLRVVTRGSPPRPSATPAVSDPPRCERTHGAHPERNLNPGAR